MSVLANLTGKQELSALEVNIFTSNAASSSCIEANGYQLTADGIGGSFCAVEATRWAYIRVEAVHMRPPAGMIIFLIVSQNSVALPTSRDPEIALKCSFFYHRLRLKRHCLLYHKGNLVRGLHEARHRNPGTPMAMLIDRYIQIQVGKRICAI